MADPVTKKCLKGSHALLFIAAALFGSGCLLTHPLKKESQDEPEQATAGGGGQISSGGGSAAEGSAGKVSADGGSAGKGSANGGSAGEGSAGDAADSGAGGTAEGGSGAGGESPAGGGYGGDDSPETTAGTGGSPPGCDDECALNATQCNEGQSSECLAASDGCLHWSEPSACRTGSCLDITRCEPICDDDFDCNDDIACTVDKCEVDGCTNTPDASLCTASPDGSCDPEQGCQYPNCNAVNCIAEPCGTAECVNDQCERAQLCQSGETCCADVCVPQGCSDDVPCTLDTCEATGCVHVPQDSQCGGGNVCATPRCDPSSGCGFANTQAPCDDGVFCNGKDTCAGGTCSQHAGDPCDGLMCVEQSSSCHGPYSPREGPFKVLVFSEIETFLHSSIGTGRTLINQIAAEEGFTTKVSDDSSDFTAAGLAQYEVVIFLNPTGDVFNTAEEAALEAWLKTEGALVGIHSAADTESNWAFYTDLIGQYYDGHGLAGTAGQITFDNTAHPIVKDLPNPWSWTGEWWNFNSYQTWSTKPGFEILGRREDNQPVIWTRQLENYRMVYSSLGHADSAFEDPNMKKLLRGAILWAARREASL